MLNLPVCLVINQPITGWFADCLVADCLFRLNGPVVKTSASRAEDPGFESRLCWDILPGRVIPVTYKIRTPVAALPGAWRYSVSAGTGWPGVSIL